MTMHELTHHTETVLQWYGLVRGPRIDLLEAARWVLRQRPGTGRHRRPRR